MAKAWVTQPSGKLAKLGSERCPWAVEWYDPAGNRRRKTFGPGARNKRPAEKFKDKVSAELLTGTYADKSKASQDDLVADYERLRFPHLLDDTRSLTRNALKQFARIAKLRRAAALDATVVARYAAVRLTEPGKRPGETVRPTTVNLELRHLKAVFTFAAEHGYVPSAPRVRMCKESKKLPRVVDPDRLQVLLDACDAARLPTLANVEPAAWWRGLFAFLFMSGWRIGETLELVWGEVDLEKLTVVTLAETNKADRDERTPLHPAAAALLEPLRAGFTAEVFPWPHHRRTLDAEFCRIQEHAGVAAPFHGFHDFRRSFATYNAEVLGAETLKRMMRHKSYVTTQKYIRMAEDLSPATAKLFVPDALKGGTQKPKKKPG